MSPATAIFKAYFRNIFKSAIRRVIKKDAGKYLLLTLFYTRSSANSNMIDAPPECPAPPPPSPAPANVVWPPVPPPPATIKQYHCGLDCQERICVLNRKINDDLGLPQPRCTCGMGFGPYYQN
jgi:hypothetical protein